MKKILYYVLLIACAIGAIYSVVMIFFVEDKPAVDEPVEGPVQDIPHQVVDEQPHKGPK